MKLTSKGVSSTTIGLVVVLIVVVVAAGAYIALSGSGGTTTVTNTATVTATSTLTNTQTNTLTNTLTSTATSTIVSTSISTVVSSETTNTALSATLLEDGSSLLFPAFNLWIANFSQYYPNLHITTGSGGSGKGVSEAAAGTVNIGASDAFLTPAQVHANPGLLNIPLAISAQQINYNVNSAINAIHLNMSATVLAEIYNGTITTWNDPRLASLQSPSVASQLPSTTIVPIHRFDSSGDTSIFTQYLCAGDHYWNTTIGFGTTVNWPSVTGSISATGNSGMLTALSTTPGGIAYVGISYLNTANQLKFGYAHLQNRAGNFVDITAANIQSAVNARLSSVPTNETASLIYAPGANSYPIVNFEYAIVKTTQPSATVLTAVQTFLSWDINYGNAGYYLLQIHFIALPSSVAQLSLNQIASLHT